MENKYLNEITTPLKQARPKLSTTHRLEFKNVFGAVGGYVNGKIFVSYGKFGVALRLPPDTLDMLFQEKEAKHLKYFPSGHVKKEYAVLSKRILENEAPHDLTVGVSSPRASSGAESLRSETPSLSSASLRSGYFAKGDKHQLKKFVDESIKYVLS